MAINHDALKKTRAGSRGGSGWKPKAGSNRIFILPPSSQILANLTLLTDLAMKFRMHYFRLAGRPTEVSRCLEDLRQRCPACEAWRILRKSADPAMAEAVKKIGPADTYLFNILDLGNLGAGIQRWTSNFTCWDQIMDIAGNAVWGDVCDPASGVCFSVTLTPEAQTRSGHNAYHVLPEPQRLNVLPVLEGVTDWQAQLDQLDTAVVETMDAEAMRAILAEIGFLAPAAPAGMTGQLAAVAASAGAPAVVVPGAAMMAPGVVVPVVSAAVPTAVVVPGTAVPSVVAPVSAVAASTPAPITTVGTPHYDPGDGYVEKQPLEARPAGAPRCWGDFNTHMHQCQPCPQQIPCQVKTLGLA